MCLGIVGRVVSLSGRHPDLADVDVAGAVREINVAIIREEGLEVGDWILIHAGFAMEKIDEATAKEQISAIAEYTGAPEGFDDEAGGA